MCPGVEAGVRGCSRRWGSATGMESAGTWTICGEWTHGPLKEETDGTNDARPGDRSGTLDDATRTATGDSCPPGGACEWETRQLADAGARGLARGQTGGSGAGCAHAGAACGARLVAGRGGPWWLPHPAVGPCGARGRHHVRGHTDGVAG